MRKEIKIKRERKGLENGGEERGSRRKKDFKSIIIIRI